ncbi:late embryogenesis abundant protein At1g64065 [Vigna radiata var. radiata]|uniref:Late embryogenesis abundant protein At1g64065 n=1 Tax=Vigna radiata var. radiata TaxID=3916 RepID=A0A1S3VMG2_VIGRR|nr:late embryogenesis abundant protein At1g64065 [Vigna radiata var. radiata]
MSEARRYVRNISTEELIAEFPSRKRERKISKCFVYSLVIFVMIMLICLILALLMSHVGDPKIEFKSARLMNNTNNHRKVSSTSPFNFTIVVRVSLSSPKFVSFDYEASTASVTYENSSERVGVSKLKAATMEANETRDMDLTVHVNLGKKANLTDHSNPGMLKLRSYAKLSGTLHTFKLLQKRKTIRVSCTINLDFTSFSTQNFQC